MYSILAKKHCVFIDPVKGRSQRKSPPLHLSSGEVIRVSPGQVIKVSDTVFELNRKMLEINSASFVVTQVSKSLETIIPSTESPEVLETSSPVSDGVSEDSPLSDGPSDEPKKRGKRKKTEEVVSDDPELDRLIQENLNA